MQINTIIVEDEPHSQTRLLSLLEAHPQVNIVGMAQDGPQAVNMIDTMQPDLVLLDVQLPGFTGLEVLQKIRHRPMIIFVTAYDEYAIRAFDANAIDYLLKPTMPERLAEALQRVKTQSLNLTEELIERLSSSIRSPKHLDRFTVKVGDEILLVPTVDVHWINAEEKYVFIHTFNKEYIVNDTLKHLETELDPQMFIRIHKSVIINTSKIHRIKRLFSGTYRIVLSDQAKTSFDIGRTYLAATRTKLNF